MLTVDAAGTLDRISVAADALTGLVRRVPDLTATVPATPAWTVADVYAHVAAEVPRYRDDALGRGARVADAGDLAAENLELVADLPSKDPDVVAAQLRADLDDLRATMRSFDSSYPEVVFDGGTTMPADVALGALLGEFLIHGYDIARAAGQPWTIAPADVPPVLESLVAILPGWLDPSAPALSATYDLRVGPVRHVFAFAGGALSVDPEPAGRIDVHLAMKPVPGLLALYLRRGPVRMALRGEAFAWGRRPWLARRFAGMFHAP